MRKSGKSVLLVVLGIVILLAVYLVGQYNGLVTEEEGVKQSWSNVETNYQRRADLIPNLVETVKGYAEHESETFENIARLRAGYDEADTPEEYQALDQELALAINVAVEAYPELKANENFLRLQDELAGTENRIAIARQDYNAVATPYNTKIRRFPTSIVAGLMGFERHELFEAAPGSDQVPQVDFGARFVFQ